PVSSTAARLAMPVTMEINYNSDSLSVYPNPPVNNVTVTIPASLLKGQAVITLSDHTGRVLYQGRETSRKHIIDLGNIVPGVYFIT
ncbi:T9SS type A sorting domain-containing protein, partial [Microbacterium sp. GbtcB4]|uniref:T9SS type A sorting domain-containing protein n=1 Tax=Microbacterium sp. GbtcB4 TaxID=2824749 RepID=UPI001C2FE55A